MPRSREDVCNSKSKSTDLFRVHVWCEGCVYAYDLLNNDLAIVKTGSGEPRFALQPDRTDFTVERRFA